MFHRGAPRGPAAWAPSPSYISWAVKWPDDYNDIMIMNISRRLSGELTAGERAWRGGSMGAVAVFALNHEFLAVRREIKNGKYSPWAYLISNALFQARSPCLSLLLSPCRPPQIS